MDETTPATAEWDTAGALAAALENLTQDYPTDATDAPRTRITVRGPAGTAYGVELMPGHVDWLLTLLMDETTTCRNAHTGESGECAHCAGTGRTRNHRDEDPR